MRVSKLLNLSRFLPTVTLLLALFALALGEGLSLDFGSLFGSMGKSHSAGFVKTHASIEESPEIGIGIHKVPIVIPLPTLILRKSKHLVAKGMVSPIGCGGGCGGGGGGGYMMGGGGGYGGGGYGGGGGGGGGYY